MAASAIISSGGSIGNGAAWHCGAIAHQSQTVEMAKSGVKYRRIRKQYGGALACENGGAGGVNGIINGVSAYVEISANNQ